MVVSTFCHGRNEYFGVIFHLTLKTGKNGISGYLYLFVVAVFAVTNPYLKLWLDVSSSSLGRKIPETLCS